ncbi:MAG: ImmA/IrrE family metallo-endopeptidase [Bacillota bacterium]|nr:ImmA/IrrE family metallo-endopeptidase [Bacillota bacterium]
MNCIYDKNDTNENFKSFIKIKIDDLYTKKKINIPIIKDEIFNILETVSKVLYYPIKDDISAFHLKTNKSGFEHNIVFINTNLPYEKQVFAAAYEFAYIIILSENNRLSCMKNTDTKFTNDKTLNKALDKALDTNSKILDAHDLELICTQFAGEFLVRDDILEEELIKMGISKADKISLENIVRLMNLFILPYKIILKRLYEENKISKQKYSELSLIKSCGNDSPIFQIQKRLGLCSKNNEISKIKSFSNFIDLAIKSYSASLKDYEDLEYSLKLFDLKPSNFNIKKTESQCLTINELEIQHLLFEE